jgi:hypothetical protein
MRRWLATSMLLVGLGAAWPAGASQVDEFWDGGNSGDRRLIELGESLEQEGRPAEAIWSFQKLLAEYPNSAYERRASARLEWLKARNEGDFAPLAAFLKIRNRRDLTRDELSAFWKEAEKFPSGRVKRDAAAFTAEAFSGRLKDPAASIPVYETWLREPGIDQSERELAASGMALALQRMGRLSEATELLRANNLTDRPEWRFIRVQSFRRIAHPIALTVVGIFGVLALAAIGLGVRRMRWRELLAPKFWLLGAYVIVPPCVAAVQFSNPLKHDYERLATGLAVTVGAAIVAGVAARGTKLRVPLAVAAFAASLAVGLLVAEETEMIEGFLRWYGVSGWH